MRKTETTSRQHRGPTPPLYTYLFLLAMACTSCHRSNQWLNVVCPPSSCVQGRTIVVVVVSFLPYPSLARKRACAAYCLCTSVSSSQVTKQSPFIRSLRCTKKLNVLLNSLHSTNTREARFFCICHLECSQLGARKPTNSRSRALLPRQACRH